MNLSLLKDFQRRMHVCIYTYIRTYICMDIYICIYVVDIYIHVRMYVRTQRVICQKDNTDSAGAMIVRNLCSRGWCWTCCPAVNTIYYYIVHVRSIRDIASLLYVSRVTTRVENSYLLLDRSRMLRTISKVFRFKVSVAVSNLSVSNNPHISIFNVYISYVYKILCNNRNVI